jgi:hypothetical protein
MCTSTVSDVLKKFGRYVGKVGKVGKVGEVGKVGKVGKVGREGLFMTSCDCPSTVEFLLSPGKIFCLC